MFKKLFLIVPLMLASCFAMGQTAGAETSASKSTMTFADRLFGVLNGGVSTKCNDVTPATFNVKLGYRFIPRVYAFLHAGGLFGFYGEDNGQHYTKSQNIGGGLGYTFWKSKDSMDQLELRGTVASSYGNVDWKHVLYDVGVAYRLGRGVKMDIGIGYQHISSRTAGIGTYNGFYATIGFGF